MVSVSEKVSFLQRVFGTCLLGNDGINVAVCCPNPKCGSHGTPSKKKLVIRIDNDRFHCWVCDVKGRSLNPLIGKYFPSHLHEYRDKFAVKKIKSTESEDIPEEVVTVPRGFTLLATSTRSKDPDVKDTIRYAKSRGLTTRDFWYYKLGTCSRGRFRRRVIVPSFDINGELNYLVGRAIDEDTKMKYINAKVAKKDVIFNEINIDWKQELTLVEGPFDLFKCSSNATCLLGSHFTEEYRLCQEIIRNSTPILLAMDEDVKAKEHEYAKMLSSYGISVRILPMGSHSDVGEMTRSEFEEARKNAREWKDTDRLHQLINSIKSGSLV
jgi:hypothetical protein